MRQKNVLWLTVILALAMSTLIAATKMTQVAMINSTIDSTTIGAITPSTGKFTTLITTTSLTAASLNSTPIGNITPSTGVFTNLTATGSFSTASLNNTPIGNTTASTGKFTTLSGVSYMLAGGSTPQVSPTPPLAQGLYTVWNGPGVVGFGGTQFVNSIGGGVGGFEWYNTASNTFPGSLLAYMDAGGAFYSSSDLFAGGSGGTATVHGAQFTGNAASANTASALAATPTTCATGNIMTGIAANGNAICVPGSTRGNNTNGYWVKDSAGFIREWGSVTTDINNATLVVTFPTPFTDPTSISVVATTRGASTVDRITYIINGSVNVNNFTIANNGSGGFAYWHADGY